MKVMYIRPMKEKGYISLGLSDGDEKINLCVSMSDYREAGSPLVGDNLIQDAMDILVSSDKKYKATKKALRILSYGDNSEKMLEYKLVGAGFERDIARCVVHEMVSLGYINTERQLRLIIKNLVCVSNLGKRKIIPKLMAKGYSRSDIEAQIDELIYLGEIDFELAKQRLIEKKATPDADGEQIKNLLYKNGFSVC